MKTEEQIELLLKLGQEITLTEDIDLIIQLLTETAKNLIHADRCSVFLYDKTKNLFWTKLADNFNITYLESNKGFIGAVLATGDIQISVDAYQDIRFNSEIDKTTKYKTKTVLAVPLYNTQNEIIGVFQALNKKEGIFNVDDANTISLITNYVSMGLENAMLYDKFKKSQNTIIQKLATAAEYKDEETSNHTKRVAILSSFLAQKYGLDKYLVENIKIASPMHDTGKIGIEDKILKAERKLTQEEFEIMKTHSIIGYNILKDDENEILKLASKIALEHHEKWNGTGYPYQLKEENISIEGRIVAIVDVFDALTSKRVYKDAWSFEKTFNLIYEEKGKHFDPQLVDIFLNYKNQIIDIKKSYQD